MNQFLTSAQPYLSFLRDLVTIASLGVAAVVAINGLQTWRRQLKGTADYELAKRLLKATYRLRDALQSVRTPFMSSGEVAQAMKEAQLDIKPSDEGYHAASNTAVYQMRWKPVVEAYQALELEAIETEALWGPEARTATTTIRKSIASLNIALGTVLEEWQSRGVGLLDEETRLANRRIVFSMSQPEQDPFTKDLNSAVDTIEDLARPYLTR